MHHSDDFITFRASEYLNSARILTSPGFRQKRFFFSGIWSSFLEFGSNDHKNFFLCFWEHKTLWNKKILNFWPFLWNLWPFAEKKSAIFRFLGEMGFFSKVHFSYIFWSFFEVMHCRMAKNGPKLMKIYFSRL